MIELLLRGVFSLLVIFALMWGLARLVRRPLAARASAGVTVLSRAPLSRSTSVAVVRVADRALVVGVAEHQITLLGEADLAAVCPPAPAPTARREPLPLSAAGPAACPPAGPPAGPSTGPSTGAGRLPTGGAGGVPATRPDPLAGSLLSGRTWAQTLEFLRERTARR